MYNTKLQIFFTNNSLKWGSLAGTGALGFFQWCDKIWLSDQKDIHIIHKKTAQLFAKVLFSLQKVLFLWYCPNLNKSR